MKALRAILICGLLTSACGREDSEEPSLAESPGSDEDNKTLLSIALKSREELPTCGDDNKNQLAYLLDEKIFLTCNNNDWVEVQIKGSDGARGEQGLAGEKGDTGEQGVAGETVGGSMWFNPITQKYWIVGNEALWPVSAPNPNPCTSGYRLPLQAELLTAVYLGLGHKVETLNSVSPPIVIWSSEEANANNAKTVMSDDGAGASVGVSVYTHLKTEKHTVVCVEE